MCEQRSENAGKGEVGYLQREEVKLEERWRWYGSMRKQWLYRPPLLQALWDKNKVLS